jgi:hypothetical protein
MGNIRSDKTVDLLAVDLIHQNKALRLLTGFMCPMSALNRKNREPIA